MVTLCFHLFYSIKLVYCMNVLSNLYFVLCKHVQFRQKWGSYLWLAPAARRSKERVHMGKDRKRAGLKTNHLCMYFRRMHNFNVAVLKYIMTSKILYKLKKPMCYFGCDIMRIILIPLYIYQESQQIWIIMFFF